MLALSLTAGSLAAQHGGTTASNPFNSMEDRQTGARIFRNQCAACHGPNGAGGSAGPNLTTGGTRRTQTDSALFDTISKGIPGTPMPGYPGNAREVWQLTAYVRSLSLGRAAAQANGDPKAGAAVYASAGCGNCHSRNNEDTKSGPDLTALGSRLSLNQISRSITHPNDNVEPEYWRVKLRLRDGREITGTRINEDTFSIQYRDRNGLRSVSKSDVAEYTLLQNSAMPSYEGKLTPAEIQNLVAFLVSEGAAK